VLESGIGSAALTTVLASMVQPDGKVISYENRVEFIMHAQKNLKQAGLLDMVTIKQQDITVDNDVSCILW
jgi:tRNA (adenine57-N1/adenine58-N1)-methyltransferase